jgi:hypothetical protein
MGWNEEVLVYAGVDAKVDAEVVGEDAGALAGAFGSGCPLVAG